MDSGYDVFAELTDFCENYAVDKVVATNTKLELDASVDSDSETEELFPNCTKTTTRQNGKKKSPVGRNKKEHVEDTRNPLADEPVVGPQTRSRRQRMNTSIEEYMFQQTLATLQAQQPTTVQILTRAAKKNTQAAQNNSQRGRARRRYMAERATKVPVIGTIDLAGQSTPPLPPRSCSGSAIVCLDSDKEDSFLGLDMGDVGNNSSFDIENAEIGVKVKWGDKIDVVPHRRHQKFVDLMKIFADRENVIIHDVLLNLNDRIIEPDDTPDSIDYKIVQFISGRIIHNTEMLVPAKRKDANSVNIKIQSDAFKRPLEVSLKNDQQFKILYIKCSEELKISCDQIKLSFDGDLLILNQTPKDLDFEGGEVIDCRIVK